MQEVGNDSLTYLNVSHNSLTEVEHFPWKNIEVLDLSSNLIRGNLPIPASTIRIFLISNNRFNGEVSSLICNASDLRILDLSHNYLSGTIPRCFGNLSNSLQFLNLKKNTFYGTIPPTFAEGCQLTNFNLNGNLLEGPLTPSILNCNDLEVLDLGNNKINDTFPHWLGSLPQLQVLVLKSNHMHGSLCVNSSKSSPFFSKIQIFDLSSNYFSGPLPVRYINSFKAIINLEKIGSIMSYMGVYGRNGSGFYTYSIGIVMKGQYMELVKIFTMWMIIDLSNNQFEGGIPKVFGKLNLLKGLNLSHNNLNGGIPTSIGNLTSLEWLDLSSNRLSWTIPNRLADLPFLSFFNVSQNQLHGQIPQGKQFNTFGNDSYQGNKGLCGFPVSKGCNIIEPAPPNVLEKDGSKSNIAFGWNVVLIGYGCGVVFGMSVGYVVFQTGKPKWLVNLVENQQEKRRRRKSKKGIDNIAVLDLSSNLISGNLPIPASTIRIFLTSNNSFNGEVSSLICNATYIKVLDLSRNYLSGTIPQCFGNLSNSLQFLNLKKNKFYGTIPPTFAEGCQLSNFNLNGNLLEGPLTPSILNCNDLEVLDLGSNKINDTFPHWLGSLPFFQVLVLKSNHMHGSLCVNSSKSSPFFSKIQIFDLSSNYFSGPLPVRYINSFEAIINLEKIESTMSYMGLNDLGGGGFYTYSIGIVMRGQDMELVKIFTMWMIIDLSNNQFEGLSGTIPNRLADLPFLSSFNVSENQLHGQIPQGKQFNTFGNDSYEGNKGLCGFPVSKGCNIIEPAPPNVLGKDGSKSNITFGWKVVLIGYGCGVVFGMSVGYVVFQTGKPKWVNLVEIQHEKKRRRKSKDGSRSNG
ncbi:receptor-like protein Cf-9 homolog [Gossypium raimondii]|uniref:receptor-like protein Cf-9 homolog n=1 Tax=Gossypium raimondii TaxID=29730 RepID=UPI00227CEC6F|nr:receptor-like protein Cf-9 homolog [Gossypium raimondii]